jgi:hypothetical protein
MYNSFLEQSPTHVQKDVKIFSMNPNSEAEFKSPFRRIPKIIDLSFESNPKFPLLKYSKLEFKFI